MPMHNWKRVEAGVFHVQHHGWIEEIYRALNQRLPKGYYALPEQHAGGFGPDVLTLQRDTRNAVADEGPARQDSGGVATLPRPKTHFMTESAGQFYRRKQNVVAIRHITDDSLVAVLEIVSPGNKSGQRAFRDFVEKASWLLEQGIHLLVVDPLPPTKRDPQGIHAAIWEEVEDQPFTLPPAKPLVCAAYECDLQTRAYVEPFAVGDLVPAMPLYLKPNIYVEVPLEATYQTAFEYLPEHLRRRLLAE